MTDYTLRKRIIFISILIAVFLSVTVVLGEISVRLFSKQGYITPEIIRNSSLQYEPSLFSRHVFPQKDIILSGRANAGTDAKWHINEKGYRGRNFTVVKPKGMIRIMFYGGSAVFDYGSPEGKDWPHRVEDNLRKEGFAEVEVINAGIPEHASFDSLGRFFAEGHNFNPDYVILYNAWNDIKYFRSGKFLLRKFRPYVESRDPRINYRNVFDRILCEHSQLFVRLRGVYYEWRLGLDMEGQRPSDEDPPQLNRTALKQYRLNIETFVDVARNAGAEPILMTQARLVSPNNNEKQKKRIGYHYQRLDHQTLCEAFEKTDEIIKQIAQEKKVLLIDASNYLTGQDKLFMDHVHLTDQGGEELAKIVAWHLAEWLKKKGIKHSKRVDFKK